MLPVVEPDGKSTGRQILIYSLALIPISLVPAYLGMILTLIVLVVSGLWLVFSTGQGAAYGNAFIQDPFSRFMEDLMLDAAVGAVDSIPRQRRKDLDLVQEAVRRAVRGAANEAWGKKPLVTVFVTR